MSIRSNSLPLRGDVSPELQDVLRRNGMQAHILFTGDKMQLAVQSHDSPLIRYDINKYQYLALQDGGTNSSNRKAYQTFNNIVSADFDMPKNYVSARNANGRVAMGLHGYRIGAGEYGMPMGIGYGRGSFYPQMAYGPGFLGWTPRRQEGFHMRRVEGALFMQGGGVIVPERPDRRLRPGELQSGGYGYYYKGDRPQPQKIDPLQDLQQVQATFVPVAALPRPVEKDAIAYKEHITSPVYFTNEKWQEVLASHGIVIDADKKQMVIQSKSAPQDFHYDLSVAEVDLLTKNDLKGASVNQRIEVINNIISEDFDDKVTFDMLNSKNQLDLKLKPEVEAKLQQEAAARMQLTQQPYVIENARLVPMAPHNDPEAGYVSGQALEMLNEDKGWFREGKHGREVDVSDVWVEKVEASKDSNKQEQGKDGETKYKMSAVINGQEISHEITEKQYDKFMAMDDYHRLKMVSKVFDEVDMKTLPGRGFNFGAALLAGLQVASEATFLGADIAHNIEHIKHPHGQAPEIYAESHGRANILFNPLTDSPEDLARRAYEKGVNDANRPSLGIGR